MGKASWYRLFVLSYLNPEVGLWNFRSHIVEMLHQMPRKFCDSVLRDDFFWLLCHSWIDGKVPDVRIWNHTQRQLTEPSLSPGYRILGLRLFLWVLLAEPQVFILQLVLRRESITLLHWCTYFRLLSVVVDIFLFALFCFSAFHSANTSAVYKFQKFPLLFKRL